MENIYLFAIESQTNTIYGETKEVGAMMASGESVLSITRSLKKDKKGLAVYVFQLTPEQVRKLIKDLLESLENQE